MNGLPKVRSLVFSQGSASIWAAWAGFPDFCHANVSFVYGGPHGYAPEPIELPLGTISTRTEVRE